jgi:DNA transformation protein
VASTQSMLDFVIDQLSGLAGVRARKMFGEYGIYLDEKLAALLCDDQVLLKPTDAGRALLGAALVEAPPYPGAKPCFLLGADAVEDAERLCALLRATADALPVPTASRASRARASFARAPRRPL